MEQAILDFPEKDYKSQHIIGQLYKLYGRELIGCSKVEFKTSKKKITIGCKVHKIWFEETYDSLKRRKLERPYCGLCPGCRKEIGSRYPKRNIFRSEFPEELKSEFPDKSNKTLDFIMRVREKHGDKFDFTETEYLGFNKKVKIRCKIHNILYETTPKIILKDEGGNGCPMCCRESLFRSKMKNIPEVYIDISKELYPEKDELTSLFISKSLFSLEKFGYDFKKLDFSKTVYRGVNERVIVTCPIHKVDYELETRKLICPRSSFEFLCPECRDKSLSLKIEVPQELLKSVQERYPKKSLRTCQYICRLIEIFGENKFDYSETNYITAEDKVTVRCIEHDISFQQPADSLLEGHNCCPSCSTVSKGEKEIKSWLDKNSFEYIPQFSCVANNRKVFIDFRIVKNNVEYWIEFNGRQHYEPVDFFGGEKGFYEYQIPRDKDVSNYCEEHNIKLIIISYKEFNNIDSILTNIFLSNED